MEFFEMRNELQDEIRENRKAYIDLHYKLLRVKQEENKEEFHRLLAEIEKLERVYRFLMDGLDE